MSKGAHLNKKIKSEIKEEPLDTPPEETKPIKFDPPCDEYSERVEEFRIKNGIREDIAFRKLHEDKIDELMQEFKNWSASRLCDFVFKPPYFLHYAINHVKPKNPCRQISIFKFIVQACELMDLINTDPYNVLTAEDNLGNTLLYTSIIMENHALVNNLIRAGSSISVLNNAGFTGIQLAYESKNDRIFEILLRSGATFHYLINDYSAGYSNMTLEHVRKNLPSFMDVANAVYSNIANVIEAALEGVIVLEKGPIICLPFLKKNVHETHFTWNIEHTDIVMIVVTAIQWDHRTNDFIINQSADTTPFFFSVETKLQWIIEHIGLRDPYRYFLLKRGSASGRLWKLRLELKHHIGKSFIACYMIKLDL